MSYYAFNLGNQQIRKCYIGGGNQPVKNAAVGDNVLYKFSNGEQPVPPEPSIPNNELWYISTDGNIVVPSNTNPLPTIVSNTYENGLGKIVFATDLTRIEDTDLNTNGAFYNNTKLFEIVFPSNISYIGQKSFSGCSELTTIKFDGNIPTIKNVGGSASAFSGTDKLTNIYIKNLSDWCKYGNMDDLYITYVLSRNVNIYLNNSIITSLTIPNDVTTINNNAFQSLSIVSLSFNNLLTDTGKYAFANCKSLTNVSFNENLTTIGNSAFYSCSGLTSVSFPNSLTTIGNSAFYNCSGLTSVSFPNSLTTIRNSAFYGCTGLTSVTIPDSVTSIGNQAFGSVSAKLSFTKLYSTYTNKIFNTPTINITYTYNVEFNISEIPAGYNISSMLPQHTGSKGTITYNIYTDLAACKDQALALANQYTIVNVYHIDVSPWA